MLQDKQTMYGPPSLLFVPPRVFSDKEIPRLHHSQSIQPHLFPPTPSLPHNSHWTKPHSSSLSPSLFHSIATSSPITASVYSTTSCRSLTASLTRPPRNSPLPPHRSSPLSTTRPHRCHLSSNRHRLLFIRCLLDQTATTIHRTSLATIHSTPPLPSLIHFHSTAKPQNS